MKNRLASLLAPVLCALAFLPAPASAQVPNFLNYQGRVAVGTVNFNGTGQFRFALTNSTGSTFYWTNDGTGSPGGQPTNAVSIPVSTGLYSVLLGDPSIPNMTAIPANVWANPDVRLRVFFSDGVNPSLLLSPDQRVAPAAYLADGAVGSNALAGGAVSAGKIAAGAVGTSQLADGAVSSTKLAAGATAAPVSAAGATQNALANTAYAASGAAPTTFTLPTAAAVGDTVQITGAGAGGWSVVPGAGQGISLFWTPRESNRNWQSVASSGCD